MREVDKSSSPAVKFYKIFPEKVREFKNENCKQKSADFFIDDSAAFTRKFVELMITRIFKFWRLLRCTLAFELLGFRFDSGLG